ncbi:MAG TPA: 2,5-dichloro-2,5-cyclohexadiene-1,4-diol dehydrogenase, partial [Erythrobacter sp.]|nr:2,5-dichloro-2,5-cyclohexadiene-1,4-diol dehydrogenase [Erythrobacter sp.]HBC14415.1 2,5-dichloro-2,5-cyclohexadiene-1,4-diol dehydrogenase [Erythrobacter sp.]
MRFLDKTVIVTGAASGIGAAATALFAGEGATVFASDIDVAGGEKLARETPGDVRFVECDVCDPAAIKALMDHAAQETGGIDTLFNNAGAGGARESIAEIEPEAWDRTMDLLLRSVAMGIRYAVPHMKGRKGASIVNVSSVAAVGPGYSPTTYAVAKAGVLHLTKCAATDLAQFGIRVNAVQPGFINTNIFTATMDIPDAAKEQAKAMIAQMSSNAQPVARGGQSDDIAQAVA